MELQEPHSELEISVLVVEDEILTRTLISKLLATAGFRVVGATSTASTAMALYRQFQPDVVLLDINLGEGPTGLDVAGALRRITAQVGLVFLSSITDIRTISPNQPTMPEASVYLNKADISKTEHLIAAIQRAFELSQTKAPKTAPESRLISEPFTDIQLELMRLISLGKSNSAIAEIRFTTLKSTETAISRLAKKLNIPSDDASNQRVLIAREFYRLNNNVQRYE